ncbi:glycoside hydrolase [Paenibacillus sp. FSL H8-0548]|uniref:GH25 family lysozyme n=1 Tax=Paenibacillus sp. FSL H8-0548 TaxID=1920422 RepID=UPI00096F926B|nr:GH25 family lysozyme [Paenibacillus sp. FSL H8-0548]OMF21431.1 glycoside hydrolase [Paenibacillus sp. FSL H8-0548]
MKVKRIIVIFISIVLLLGFLEYKGLIWHNSLFAMKYKVRGLDVSHYQGDIDWRTVANTRKYQFVYMKATEGNDFTDDTYQKNWDHAKANGLLVGAYHFFSARSSGEQQADHFISVVDSDEASLPPVIDIEIALTHDVAVIQHELKAMSDKLEAAYKKKPIFYVTYDTYNTYTASGFESYDIWIRDIVKHPSLQDKRGWLLWQYCNRGHVAGIDAYVDINVFKGDQAAFDARFKG